MTLADIAELFGYLAAAWAVGFSAGYLYTWFKRGFGTRFNRKVTNGAGETLTGDSKLLEAGTFITRIDLAGNFEVSDYAALCSAAMVRRIGQKLPMAGKYGPTWGYDAKRSNWTKAKLYDKTGFRP